MTMLRAQYLQYYDALYEALDTSESATNLNF